MSPRTRGLALIIGVVLLLGGIGSARAATPGLRLFSGIDRSARSPLDGGGPLGRVSRAELFRQGFSVNRDGRVGAMVELTDPPALDAYLHAPGVNAMAVGARPSGAVAAQAVAAARAQIARLEQAQQEMADVLTGPGIGADLIYRVQRVYNGIAVEVDPAALDRIRALPGVKAVHPLVPKRLENFTSVPFIGAPQVWGGLGGGATGGGVKVGVIDTGIDYLHHDFGGSGTYRSDGKYTSAGWPTTAKVVGGYDFAGDNYDATAASGSAKPSPDPDPMDCNGHGSHVAGTVAGYGENADGSTFGGPWNAGTPVSTFKIGPGVAPEAQLVALKIFGCSGSTSLVTKAIEWATDPNQDGNFGDHLDVITMSLGSAYGSSYDADAIAADRAAQLGVVVVAAAGNAGDAYFVVGTPGVAGRAIAVAATGDPGVYTVNLHVNTPSAIAGDYMGQPGQFGPPLPATPVTGTVVYGSPHDGCSALTNAGAVSGNIAIVDRNHLASNACNFTVKVKNAQNAGAIAVIVADDISESGLVNMVGSDSTITIPSFFISLADGQTIEAQLPTPGVNATLTKIDLADTVASFSARGPRMGDSVLKPDIAAPGLDVFSAEARGGDTGVSLSGTSMATPHVAGVMALLRQLHPSWSVEELKALAMNTAADDVTLNPNLEPPLVGTGRSGAGRVNAADAATAQSVAFDADDPGIVSVSFGAVEVSGTVTLTKHITVENKSGGEETYALSFTPVSTVPGVTLSFPGGTSVAVPAGGSATIPLQLAADAAALRHTMDPSIGTTQGSYPRSWLSEEDGYVTVTPSSGTALRVPVYAAVRPVSAMGALQSTLGLSGGSGVATLDLAGQGISTGTAYPTDILSLVSALELVEDNPSQSTSDARFLGVASDYAFQVANGKGLADSTIYFGVAMQEAWSSPVPVVMDIMIDTNNDGTADYDLTVTSYTSALGSDQFDDVYVAELCTVSGSNCTFLAANGVTPDVLDTVPMNTDVIVLPVAASALGLSGSSGRFSFSFNRSSTTTQVVHTFDPASPGLSFGGAFAVAGSGQPIFADLPGQLLQVSYDQARATSDGALGILLLHHHNAAGSHAEKVATEFGACSVSAAPTVPSTSTAGVAVAFQAGASATSCSGTASFFWDFGDGATSSLQSPSHAYGQGGTYTWRLVAAYGSFSVTKTGTITVTRQAGSRPVRRRLGHAT